MAHLLERPPIGKFWQVPANGLAGEPLRAVETLRFFEVNAAAHAAPLPPNESPLFPGSKRVAQGYATTVYLLPSRSEPGRVAKVPRGTFPEVNTVDFLEQSARRYELCQAYIGPFTHPTQFERERFTVDGEDTEINILYQLFQAPDAPIAALDLRALPKNSKDHFRGFVEGNLAMLEDHQWMPDFQLERRGLHVVSFWNLNFGPDGKPLVTDFTEILDPFLFNPEANRNEVDKAQKHLRHALEELSPLKFHVDLGGKPELQTVTLPKPFPSFEREPDRPDQKAFGPTTRNITIIPLRKELHNGWLLNYLQDLNAQDGLDPAEKIGVIFLNNDRVNDSAHVKDEVRLTDRYTTLLASGDLAAIEQLDIPQAYKDVAKAIVDRGVLEIRTDFVHSSHDKAHFGGMMISLLDLIVAFKSKDLDEDNIIPHFKDAETIMPASYMETQNLIYANTLHHANFTDYDIVPGIFEEDPAHPSNRDALIYLDTYRVYRFGRDTFALIMGDHESTKGTISARLSALYNTTRKQIPIVAPRMSFGGISEGVTGRYGMASEMFKFFLEDAYSDDDYQIGGLLRTLLEGHRHSLGTAGEVFWPMRHRPLPEDSPAHLAGDGEDIHSRVSNHDFRVDVLGVTYDLTKRDQVDAYISRLENLTALTHNEAARRSAHSSNFAEQFAYLNMVAAEVQKEKEKVARRGQRLINYISSIADKTKLDAKTLRTIAPYLAAFPNEVAAIRERVDRGETAEIIAKEFITEYESFFNPDAEVHRQIGRLRALKLYAFNHNISWRKHGVEKGKLPDESDVQSPPFDPLIDVIQDISLAAAVPDLVGEELTPEIELNNQNIA